MADNKYVDYIETHHDAHKTNLPLLYLGLEKFFLVILFDFLVRQDITKIKCFFFFIVFQFTNILNIRVLLGINLKSYIKTKIIST